MSVPIILCGHTEAIGRGVIEGLKPEYEVIRFIMTPEQGCTDLPLLLSDPMGDMPASASSLGSQDFSRAPFAVVLGGGYDDEAFETMQKSCNGKCSVPWLRPDLTKQAPPLGPEYGKAMVLRVKAVLDDIQENDAVKGTVVHY